MRACLLVVLSVLVGATQPGHAQAEIALSLSEVLRRASEHPPDVALARANVKRARAALYTARGAYLPRMSVDGSSGLGYDNRATTPNKIIVPPDVPPEQRDDFLRYARTPRYEATTLTTQGSLTVDYTLVDASRRPTIDAAAQSADADAHDLADVRRRAQLVAVESYLTCLAADALLEDARLTVSRRTEQVEAIARLVQAGVRPSVDLTRAQIDLVAARHGVEVRAIEVDAARGTLAVAIGNDPGQPVRPIAIDDARWPEPRDPAATRTAAVAERPELARLTASLGARRAEHRAARAARLPTLGLLGSGNLSHADIWSGTGIQGIAYGASGALALRWTALEPSVWRRPRLTQAELSVAEQTLNRTSLTVRATATEAAYAVKRTHALLDQATQVLATAEVARSAQLQRYRAGVASLLELLDAESIAQTARRQRIEAERDHRIARARLLAESNELELLAR